VSATSDDRDLSVLRAAIPAQLGGRSSLADQVAAWYDAHAAELDPAEFDSVTLSGLSVAPVYTPLDADTGDSAYYADHLGLPGSPPYTRGVSPAMYREHLWVMGQYSGQATPSETNRRIRALLAGGQRGFSIALDLPTQNGYDSDHPLAVGEVGRVGVPIDTLRDAEDLLEGIDLSQVAQIRTTANAIGPLAIALFIAAAERKGVSPHSFKVMLQNDVLKEYIARGTYIFPPEHGLKFSVDAVEYCALNLPHWEPIEFCGYHIRDSGATAVQELGIAFANGIEYIEACLRRGLTIDDFGHSAYMFLSAHLEIFEEVAKFRAARRIWSRLMSQRYGATREETKALKIFAYTLGGALSAQQPMNNVARVAYQSLAAVLGGVQTLATSSYDEALGVPSDDAAKLALRTQQVLGYETGVVRTADPLGGSYYVEHLTDRMEEAVNEYIAALDARGGILDAIASGELQHELADEAYRHQKDVEEGRRPKVGLNRFADDGQAVTVRAAKVDGARAEAEQIARLAAVRSARDGAAVITALAAVRDSAVNDRNTIPSIIEAVRQYATLGEICEVLTDIWGRYRGSTRL
jgi:methylmalonyl-CoA mutase N-terminal domain/subunit